MKRLKRSKKDKVFAGICGGIGEFTDVDPVVWRLLIAFGAVASFSLLFWGYILAWVIIPLEE